ncbi:dual OB domain-containing protein [Caulobacter endophyticus]|uniref:dual OB domain-containing protein n=1 Tax=Caulobacter endophyticus TaxID=2172652 RepID=UPI00240F86F7|nr:hypothetical protein [Caulobacter endophyticus]MDG2527181.1 hypothetical protein [Caulobacter endophyticus]
MAAKTHAKGELLFLCVWGWRLSYEIVVTEVTLYGKLRCVAGFDLQRGRMIRPEPSAGDFWPAVFCGPRTIFHPGHVVKFLGATPETPFPHRTEDVVVHGTPDRTAILGEAEFKKVLSRAGGETAAKVFARNLVFEGLKAYVPAGSQCGSLASVNVGAERLRLNDRPYRGEHQLRLAVVVNDRPLSLPVGAKDLKQAFRNDGIEAASKLLPRSGLCQVRLGLARPFDAAPDRCYLQVNGIHAL